MNKITLSFLSVLFVCNIGYSQLVEAWVYLTEKPNATQRILSPEDFLSAKSIARKSVQQVEIDARDLPLEASYITQIKNTSNINYLAHSKWFNAIYVEGQQQDISALLALSFVEDIYFMGSHNTLVEAQAQNAQVAFKQLVRNNKFDLENLQTPVTASEVSSYPYSDDFIQQLNLQELHNLGYKGEGITIAVLDNGFYKVDELAAFDRARSRGTLLGGYDFEAKSDQIYTSSTGSHGTNVLGCMLGYIEDLYQGTAIDASYYLFRTEVVTESPKEEAYWVAAAEKADSLGVDIINTSLGYTTFDNSIYNYSNSDMDGVTSFISRAAGIANEKGMLSVTSAGNSGRSAWRIISAPADNPDGISVGAVTATGTIASFSSVGPNANGSLKPDVVAMGQSIYVVNTTGSISLSNGTSFSSPVLAGAMACLKQTSPDESNEALKTSLKASSDRFFTPDITYGNGIPDFYKAYESLHTELSQNTLEHFELPVSTMDDLEIYTDVKNKQISFSRVLDRASYQVYTLSGELISQDTLFSKDKILVEGFSSGLYLLNVDESQNSKTFKFVVL